MFLLMCPKCGNKMKYQPVGNEKTLAGKKKQCVYCGYSIPVSKHVLRRL